MLCNAAGRLSLKYVGEAELALLRSGPAAVVQILRLRYTYTDEVGGMYQLILSFFFEFEADRRMLMVLSPFGSKGNAIPS